MEQQYYLSLDALANNRLTAALGGLAVSGPFTLGGCFRTSAAAVNLAALSLGGGATDLITLALVSGTLTGTAGSVSLAGGQLNDAAWHQVLLTSDGTTVTLLADGAVVATAAAAALTGNSDYLIIGGTLGAALDAAQVFFSVRAWSTAERTAWWNGGRGRRVSVALLGAAAGWLDNLDAGSGQASYGGMIWSDDLAQVATGTLANATSSWITNPAATLATPRLASLADLKLFLGETSSDYDELLTALLVRLEGRFAGELAPGLDSIFIDDWTEYATGGGPHLQLRHWPVASITSIIEDSSYGFSASDALTPDTDYRLLNGGLKGICWRCYGHWLSVPDSIKTAYRGGFVAVGATPAAGETALPAELTQAAIMQAAYQFRRRHDLGIVSAGQLGGSWTRNVQDELLPEVRQVLEKYRRHSL